MSLNGYKIRVFMSMDKLGVFGRVYKNKGWGFLFFYVYLLC